MALNTNLGRGCTERHVLRLLVLKYQTHQVALLVSSAPYHQHQYLSYFRTGEQGLRSTINPKKSIW